MIKHIVGLAIVLYAVSLHAQVSTEEAYSKLQKRQQAATAPVTTTQPAELSVAEAKAQCMANMASDPTYQKALATAAAAKKHLDDVRASGTAEEKLNASHDFVAADQAVKRQEAAAFKSDAEVQKAMAKESHESHESQSHESHATTRARVSTIKAMFGNIPKSVFANDRKNMSELEMSALTQWLDSKKGRVRDTITLKTNPRPNDGSIHAMGLAGDNRVVVYFSMSEVQKLRRVVVGDTVKFEGAVADVNIQGLAPSGRGYTVQLVLTVKNAVVE